MTSLELIEILLTILKAVVILLVVVTRALMSFGERRLLVCSRPVTDLTCVGWGGSLQLVADMIKMFFKEDWIPEILGSRHLYPGTDDCLYLAAAGLCNCASQSGLGWLPT